MHDLNDLYYFVQVVDLGSAEGIDVAIRVRPMPIENVNPDSLVKRAIDADCRERRSQLRERPSVRASRLTPLLFGLQEAGPGLPTSGRSAVADHQARWASQSSA